MNNIPMQGTLLVGLKPVPQQRDRDQVRQLLEQLIDRVLRGDSIH